MQLLQRLILTCLVSGFPLLAIAQFHIHFDKEGKIEKMSHREAVTKLYPSILSKDTLYFKTDSIKIPESPYWKLLQTEWDILSPSPLPSNPTNDIFNEVRSNILSCLGELVSARHNKVLQYDATNIRLPLRTASTTDVFEIETIEYDRDLIKAPFRKPAILNDRDRVEYKLIRKNLDNDIIQKHLNKTKGMYRGWPAPYDGLLLTLRQKFRYFGWAIDSTLISDSLQHTSGFVHQLDPGILDELDKLAESIASTNKFYRRVLSDNKEWIASWLWYTGGYTRLNPFPYADPAPLTARANQEIKELESELAAMSNREVSLNQNSQKERMAFLLSRLATLRQAREDLGKANDDYKKWLAKLSVESEVVYNGVLHGSVSDSIRWLHHYDAARDFRFMNTGKTLPNMVANMDEVIVYTHNLKADDKVAVNSALTPFQPKSELEITADAIATELGKSVGGSTSLQAAAQLIASLSTPSVTRAASIAPVPAGPTSAFGFPAETVDKILSGHQDRVVKLTIDAINKTYKTNSFYLYDSSENKLNITYDGLKNGYDLTSLQYRATLLLRSATTNKDLLEAQRVQKAVSDLKAAVEADRKAEALRIMFVNFDVVDQIAYTELIQDYVFRRSELMWLSAQTIPILSLKLEPNETPIYRTHTEFPEKKVAIESSNKVAYTLTLNEKTTVGRHTYSKYFMSRFMPSFGLVYICGDRSALRFDETTGQFKQQEKDFDHIEALVGVKWYPWETNPARKQSTDKLIRRPFDWRANKGRGSAFINTFYVSGGLGVRRQLLRNYHLGIGFDLFPGLSVQGGGNFIFQKHYELENAKIKKETEVIKPYVYVGLGLDLGLVTNLIRLIIP